MDSESLDRCIQTALSSIYPPFQATSPTVLRQVLNVVHSCYRGDRLRYLIHFLLPAKQFLQNIQQDACLQYSGLLFSHKGWPLCIRERIVVQLCPLDQCLLRPGDFYLLVSPPAPPTHKAHSISRNSCVTSSPCLLVCSVSAGSYHVEQTEVSELALRSLFSMAWLDSVNRERELRGASRLERCLLSAHRDVFRVPWEDLVYPQFISQPRTSMEEDKSSVKDEDMFINTSHDLCRDTISPAQDVKLLPSSTKTNQPAVSTEGEDSEGEYVELTELPLPRFSPQKGSLTQSISLQHRARSSTHPSTHTHTYSAAATHALPDTHIISAVTHAPTIPLIHPAGTTHSSWSCVEVNSQTVLCSSLIEENLNHDSCGPIILTPVSSTTCSSPSAPPKDLGTSSCQLECQMSQEQIEGTDSATSLNLCTEPGSCTEHREGEEEERGEGELGERWQRRNEIIVSADESEEEEVQGERVEQLERAECRRDDGLLLEIHTAAEMEEEESEEMEEDGDEEGELEEIRAKEVEVEEEVQVIIVQQRQESRKEQHVMDRGEDKRVSKEEEEERGGEQILEDKEAEGSGTPHTHTEGSDTPHTHTEGSDTPHTHTEGSDTPHTHTEGSDTPHTHTEGSDTQHTHTEGSDTQHTHTEVSDTPHTRTEGSDTPHTHTEGSDTPHTHTEGSGTPHTRTEGSDTPHTRTEGSDTPHTRTEGSDTPHTRTEGSDTPHTRTEGSDTPHTHTEGSGTPHTRTEGSGTPHTHTEGSDTPHTHTEGSDTQHTHTEGSDTQHTHTEGSDTPASDLGSCSDKLQESENGHKEEEAEKEEAEEEVGEGRTAELQDEGSSSETPRVQSEISLLTGPSPTQPAGQSAAPTVPVKLIRSSQCSQSSFSSVLLRSGVVCLPGTRDRSGRALLTVCTTNAVWSNPDCDSAELLRLLLYYTSTLRKEVRPPGLTVLVDARRAAPVPALFSALRSLQDSIPGSIHTVLLLINKDSSLRLDKPAATQVEVLNSLKSVQKHVELHQLPSEFGGSFIFSQSSWLCFRSRVEQLTNQCEDVINLLQKTINILQSTPLPAAAEEAELLLSRYKAVMRSILEDSRLVQLQQEGGASLSRLCREESTISVTEDYRVAVETVSSLYEKVDELLHRLVTLSNARTQELQFIKEFRSLEEGFTEVTTWLEEVGEVRLKSLDEPGDSLELLNKKQQDFKDFYTTAYDHCKRGEALLSRLKRWDDMSSADLRHYEVKVHSFWAQLQDFSQRVNATSRNIDRAVRLYSFLDQAYGWALEGMRHLAGISMEECTMPDKCQFVIGCLEDYHHQHPPIPDTQFQEMKAAAGELRGERGLRQWSFAWSKCQETKKMFDRKMEVAIRTRDSSIRRRSDASQSRNSASLTRKTLSGLWGGRETSTSPPEESVTTSPTCSPIPTPPQHNFSPFTPTQHMPLLRLLRSVSSEEASDRVDFCSSSPSLPHLNSSAIPTPSSPCSSFSSSRRQQLRKTQSFDCPSTPEVSRPGPCPRALSEPVRRGNTGVFIRGLEVSSSEAADHTLCPRTAAHGWAGQGIRSPGTPGTPRATGSHGADPRPRGSKLHHIVEEMVTTEREYVRSLRYIIHHYFPEMDRPDLPQDLRGKRSVIFGNLEKLLDFHSQFFLRELEACWKHPLRVSHCFLRHQEQFSLYALYSKNKPKSDSLLANHGLSFFRRKQVELGDKMDLSSYLLKPIQRMSKYALLLTDLMKEVAVAQEAELVVLQAATNMVKFQLRHGNDLLAMDAIRNCDVNLKEQGQLIRQDEFTVWTGRRKCQRHVFLFEELILFSKPKKMEGGLDVFIYKHSFKTADVGLTESTGDDGLRFEIWFRRRTTKNQTFILQATATDVKYAWTSNIARILWTQATRNKEMRLKEMVSMGVGNKPFLDIQPSDAAISDRAVHYIMKSRGARTRASIAISVFDHSNPFKRGMVTSDPTSSGPSSSSLLGPLNLHIYSQTLASSSSAAEGSFITSCIEEDEQEHETGSQPSMTTESSGSSSRCLSGSTGSDSGCISSHLQEALPEEVSPPRQTTTSNKQHLNRRYISPKMSPVIGQATIV